ncbi:MAG: hypothetical protein MJ053_05925 [Elusimicrobiaceae bacterium]|nr:hypothetical protein [Elusimicrobiaceae bacterium]
MSNRKRLNLSLSETDYNGLNALADKGGFNGSCALVCALIAAYIQYAEKHQKRAKKPLTIEQEIKAMFEYYEGWDTKEDKTTIANNSISKKQK